MNSFTAGGRRSRPRVVYPIRVRHSGGADPGLAYAQASAALRQEGLPEIESDGEGGHHVQVDPEEATGIEASALDSELRHARAAERVRAIVGGHGIELDLEGPYEEEVETLPGLPLYVAVAAGCNLACWYCTEHGENRAFGPHVLPTPRLEELLAVAYERGFRVFRFTGGEPTLRKDLPQIMRASQALGDDVQIAITTNGTRLERMLDTLAGLRRPRVFLSVDGLASQSGAPPGREREFEVSKWLTPEMAELIEELLSIAEVRLNYVLTRSNAAQLWELIDFAASRGIDVKVFELLLRDFIGTGGLSRHAAFADQYVPIRSLIPELISRFGPPTRFPGLGGRGIPMMYVSTGSSRVVYFDSLSGSHYSKRHCGGCRHFPCQEGLYAPVLNASGTLHPAGCRNPLLYRSVAAADPGEVADSFEGLRDDILRSRLRPDLPDSLREFVEAA